MARSARRPRLLSAAGLAAAMLVLASAGALGAGTAAETLVPVGAGAAQDLAADTPVGNEDPGRTLDIQVALRLRNRPELDALVRQVSTPGSAGYGRYLTPAEFAARFGPTAADRSSVESFLRRGGLVVTPGDAGTLVNARGTVATIQRALRTSIARFRDRAGRTFFANTGPPTVPASIARVAVGVQGLDDHARLRHAAVRPNLCCAWSPPGYTPSQVRAGYGLAAAPLTNMDGAGQTVGLLELDDFQQANVFMYDAGNKLPPLAPVRLAVDGGPQRTNGGEMEVELDIELLHGVAPGAAIAVFAAPNTTVGLNDAYACMVNPSANPACPNSASGLVATANATSWGACEAQVGASEIQALDQLFAQAASQGQSFFAATGDSGAYDCAPDLSARAVDVPASDPLVTGVGGTQLRLNIGDTYNSEVAWSGSGGGASSFWGRPAYQVGPGVITAPSATRQVPDVSLNADPSTGYAIYSCVNPNASTCDANPAVGGAGWLSVGGTSAGAPAWAGFAAIYNQYALSVSRPRLGFANPLLYAAGNCPQAFIPFNDVTAGNNADGNPTGFFAGAGYDMVTGLGTLRGADLARDLTGPAPASPTVQAVNPGTASTLGGTSVTITGCGFVPNSTVMIDGATQAAAVQVFSPSAIQATLPAHAPGSATMTVVNPGPQTSNGAGITYVSPVVTAAIGSDGALWTRRDLSPWTSLGGVLIGAPAVVAVPNGSQVTTVYIGLGTDHDLWVRTDLAAWRPLDDRPVSCLDNPAAAVVGSTLYVGCMGGDRHLWTASGPLNPGVVPALQRQNWLDRGGVLVAGPALAQVPGQGLDIMVVGTDNRAYEYRSGGFTITAFSCAGHPALATNPGVTTTYFGCHAPADGSLTWSQNSGGGWSAPGSLGGRLIDGPAIAATNQGPTFYVEGVDAAVYERGLGSGYRADGGTIRFGTGAAALF